MKNHLYLLNVLLILILIACEHDSVQFEATQPVQQPPPHSASNGLNGSKAEGHIVAKHLSNGGGFETAVVAPEISTYLEQTFCHDGLCEGQEWSTWILVDPHNPWQLSELGMVRSILLETIQALDNSGHDGHALLLGYHFKKISQEFVTEEHGHRTVAIVNHDHQEISLSNSAFLRQQGFSIYHELGHVVDHRLNRRLTSSYLAHGHGEGDHHHHELADGYWVRPWGLEQKNEGTADAFAIWVMQMHAGKRGPIFPGTPVDTDYNHIAQTVAEILSELSPTESDL